MMNEELKDKIVASLDELSFLDALGLDITDLVATYSELIDANAEELQRLVDF